MGVGGGRVGKIPAGKAIEQEFERWPDLKCALGELREVGEWAMKEVSDTLTYAAGLVNASDLLSQWEGFGRFCSEVLAADPLTVLQRRRLGKQDPATSGRDRSAALNDFF